MAQRRHHWLLIRLAAQNVGRRPMRALFLGAAVMLGVGIGFASFVAGWALREGMATARYNTRIPIDKQSRLRR